MKRFSFLFFFVFSPVVFIPTGDNGSPEKDKPIEIEENDSISKTVKEENCDSLAIAIETLSNWQIAIGTYYDPKDTSQTKPGGDGKGSFERMIDTGSIALGSSFTKFFVEKKEEMEVFIETDLNVITPFGKGIFRLDDKMGEKFQNDSTFFLDFHEGDIGTKLKRQGRFRVKFRIYKIQQV